MWAFMDTCGSSVPGPPAVPRRGSLYRYAKNDQVYLCPKDKQGAPDSRDPKGGGGNGRFSYTLNGLLGFKKLEQLTGFTYVQNFQVMSGAIVPRVTSIKKGTNVKWASSKMVTFIEEHPFNNTNQSWPLDGWEPHSYISLRHFPQRREGKANFAFLDGHVESRRYPFDVDDPGPPRRTNTLLGLDILNEFRFPYDYYGLNAGGSANELAFIHKFKYPYSD
jgi:prepilin-type processing-associated H-X9-DG protein